MNRCEFLYLSRTSTIGAVSLVAILAVVALAVSFAPESDAWGYCGDDLIWEMSEDGCLTISGTGSMYDYNSSGNPAPWGMWIESVVISEGVTSIGNMAFYDCIYLSTVDIPNSVTSIGSKAFYGCQSFSSVDMPSVESIGSEAFHSCFSLSSVSMPVVTSLGDGAFYASALSSVDMPSVESIGSEAFRGCTSLSSVDIPDSVTFIGDNAFRSCFSLSSVDIPDSVSFIGAGAFSECSSLAAIRVDSSNAAYGSSEGVLFDKDMSVLVAYPAGKQGSKYTVPDTVTSIENYAFRGCTSLSSVALPESLESIGSEAFRGCFKLVDVYNYSNLALTKGSTDNGYVAFYAKNIFFVSGECGDGLAWALSEEGLLRIAGSGSMPDWSDAAQAPWYWYKDGITSVSIEGATAVGAKAFYGYAALASVDLGSVESVGMKAFSYCDGLEILVVPDSLHHIGSYAFYKCSGLKTLVVEDGAKKILGSAFSGCRSLEVIYLPSSLTYVGENAFHGFRFFVDQPNYVEPTAKNLRGNTFYRTNGSFYASEHQSEMFGENGVLYQVLEAERSVCAIGHYTAVESLSPSVAHDGCDYAVAGIGDGAFLRCGTLFSANLVNIKALGYKALGNCTGIMYMTFGEDLESIGSYALYGLSFYDGEAKLKATPDNLKGHRFSGTGGKLYLVS